MFCALVAAVTPLSAAPAAAATITEALADVARGASPRVEIAGPGVVVIDARGLARLFGQGAQVAALCRRQAAERGVSAAAAIAATRTAALLIALDAAARLAGEPGDRLPGPDLGFGPDLDLGPGPGPGSGAGGRSPAAPDRDRDAAADPPWATVTVPAGGEAAAVAPLPIALIARLAALDPPSRRRNSGPRRPSRRAPAAPEAEVPLALWRRWGLATLGALAALPAADVYARLGEAGLAWHAMARGADARPLVPTREAQPFDAACAFEWPIEAIEPLAFALGRVIDPLCARLDREGLGTVTLQTTLRLVTKELYVRRLALPMPMRDPRVLRTLIVLDLESHPPPAGIDAVTVTFAPVPGRIVQPSLLARAHPRPEAIATLTARLRAVMGDGRVGSPVALDTHRGDAVGMRPFGGATPLPMAVADAIADTDDPVAAPRLTLRRLRPPPPVRVDLERGRPVRVRALDQRRLPRLGAVRQAAGPWRSSGDWWRLDPPALAGAAAPTPIAARESVWRPEPSVWSDEPASAWDDDEWDVVLESGCAVRLARDRRADRWVVAALID